MNKLVTIPDADFAALRYAAEAEGVSAMAWIRRAITDRLAQSGLELLRQQGQAPADQYGTARVS